MAAADQGYKNIDYVVRLVQGELNDYSMHNYARLLQFAYTGFIYELNLLTMPNIKVVHAVLNEINCWNFPSDFIYYTKVGICIGGRVYTLTKNDAMCLNRHEECGIETLEDLQNDTDCGCFNWGYNFMPHWWQGSWYPKMYGMGGGINNAGYYRIDTEMRRIQFNSLIPQTELIIEYKSSGLEPDGSALVPAVYVKVLKAYIQWARIEHNDRVSLGEKQRKFDMFDMEFNQAQYIGNSFTMDEFLDNTRENQTAGVQR